MRCIFSASLVAVGVAVAILTSTARASTLTPPYLPLIVRNPYLSTWLGEAREAPWTKWPTFWTGQEIGFGILASVPETKTVYPLLGRPHDSLIGLRRPGYNVSYAVYTGAKFDASVTNLTYLIPAPETSAHSTEPVEVIISFLSPITPTSTLRQALPASYITVHVKGSFNVDIYIDLNGQWVSGDRGSRIEWELCRTELEREERGLKTWKIRRETEELLTENADRAEWGTLHFSAPEEVRHEAGVSALLRQRFSRTGTLQNEVDEDFRSIMDEEPVFAFSKSFNLSSKARGSEPGSDSVLFTIAHTQDPVVQFAAARGLTLMKPLWLSWFASIEHMLKFHYLDFDTASTLAHNYSSQLAKDAFESGSYSYRDIVALSARQVMGATSFSGTPDNPILFLKEISSNGNFQTIDVIFPSFPFFLYTNPRWLAYLLEPLLEHTLSGQYPNQYAMHDLGTHFPNATGHPDGRDEYMPVEECGDILTMALAIVNSLRYESKDAAGSIWAPLGSGNFLDSLDTRQNSPFPLNVLESREGIQHLDDRWGGEAKGLKQAQRWLEKSYPLWKQWTGYLVKYTLLPQTQLCTDDFAGWLANQTNLALKGIIGIKAMSELASIVGNTEDAIHYKNISEVYLERWEDYGITRDGTHAKLSYNWYGSWTTLYSLFADSLLCFRVPSSSYFSLSESHHNGDDQKPLKPQPGDETGFVPERIYKMQSDWYHNVRQKYGLPLDSRHLYTKSDWQFFAAAVTSSRTRSEILDSVATWVNETETDRPFTDLYMTEGRGGWPGPRFMARPVVGGHFAFLTLGRACGGKAMDALRFLDEGDGKNEGAKERVKTDEEKSHEGEL
ncbi:MAG: hypothetical protein M1835_007136 [Candelina submexicana]|nr:MAG: hypothetical protein M1835_007136 [Candelina submexicana]